MPHCLSELCYVLTSHTYRTVLTYGLEQREMGFLACTPEENIREILGATEDDLVMHCAYNDNDNPEKWALDYIEKHNSAA